ncbi:MAG: pyridoxine 5'-phosphate synthase [Bacteroidales bacterium]|nr:pyridoxine 5'-phosphate synthase [Bacteroidales bacterium]
MTKLSVNINKIATLRNARGGDIPNVVEAAINAERFGAQGITVHPRPDERHIRYSDVYDLKKIVSTEFNIEGYPNEEFIKLVLEVKPHQVTLVPDPPDALTSNAGWDTIKNHDFLKQVIKKFHTSGIRTSIFIETNIENIKYAKETGTDRVELYTEPYATDYPENKDKAIDSFVKAANYANQIGLGINAGHDLSLENLEFFIKKIPFLKEVSIGHALISDSLYFGFENTIQMYLKKIHNGLN